MSITSAFREGMHRVNAAPAILAGLLVLTFLVALPTGLALRGMIESHLGDSLAADTAASGVNYDWWQEFEAQAAGVAVTFTPRILGFGAVLDDISSLLDNRRHAVQVVATGAAYVAVWVFLVGGIIDRYARSRRLGAPAFFAVAGGFFFRFLRLAVLAWVAYAVLFGWVHGWLFERFYGWMTRDWAVERDAFALRLLLYAAFGALLAAVNVVFDYAKIRAVVEDRASMVGALAAGARFVRRHAGAAFGLYFLDGLLFLAVIGVYGAIAPGAGSAGWSTWFGLLIGELYLLARLWVKLLFYASQTALFQASLAHAEYASARVPVWPESPAAEAIAPGPRE